MYEKLMLIAKREIAELHLWASYPTRRKTYVNRFRDDDGLDRSHASTDLPCLPFELDCISARPAKRACDAAELFHRLELRRRHGCRAMRWGRHCRFRAIRHRLIAPFDWRRDCPTDLARRFPGVVGEGRGVEISEEAVQEARRKLQGRKLTGRSAST